MLPLLELTSSLRSPDPWSPITKPNDSSSLAVHSSRSLTPAGDLTMQHDSTRMNLEWDVFGSEPFVHGNGNEGSACL